jgi:UDP-N-acetyl-D-glucosamine/UDP-N-acetyl-D-galactosamine dehydrogenase
MGFYVGKQTVKKILEQGKNVLDARVLVMGMTFKENVSDIRNSKVVDVIRELESFSVHVDVVDVHADPDEVHAEYGVTLKSKPDEGVYDAVIVAVNHKDYVGLTEDYFKSLMNGKKGVFVDIKGLYRNQIKDLIYWSL